MAAMLVVLAGNASAVESGYEFFDTTHGDSQHVQNLPVNALLSAAPNATFLFGQGNGQAKHRIIDIVVEESGPNYDDWVFSAVLLKNTGHYERKSWLFWNMTEEEVKMLEQVVGWTPLDIEHTWHENHKGKQQKRYAIVMVECPEKYNWTALMNVDKDDLDHYQFALKMRPIDVDAFDDSLWPWGEPENSNLRYDAVFVENTGANYVNTIAEFVTEDIITDLFLLGYQVIDVQGIPNNLVPFIDKAYQWHVVMVQTDTSWWTVIEKPATVHEIEQKANKRLIDLKPYGPSFRATFLNQKP